MIRFLATNWLWIVLIGGFVLMHRGGGCGMGGHGGHAGHGADRDRPADERVGDTPPPTGHRHGG